MKVKFKRIASVFLTLAILVGLFSQVPFNAFAATVTHNVTGDAASSAANCTVLVPEEAATHTCKSTWEERIPKLVVTSKYPSTTVQVGDHNTVDLSVGENLVQTATLNYKKNSGDATYAAVESLTNNKIYTVNDKTEQVVSVGCLDPDTSVKGTARVEQDLYDFTVVMDLGGKTVIDKIYSFSLASVVHAWAIYKIYVSDTQEDLWNEENEVAYFNYFDGYAPGGTASQNYKLNGCWNDLANSEGQIWNFTAEKPLGQYVGYKVYETGKVGNCYFYCSEIGVNGTKLTSNDEYDGRDMTIKSSVQDTTIFDSDVMYQETAFFYEGRSEYKLLYPIDEIITVRSYDLQTEYHEGTDYTIKDGKLYLTENTRIPLFVNSEDEDYLAGGAKASYWKTNQWKYQLNISYTHSKNWDDDALYVKGLDGKLGEISKFHEKASSGETTNVVFIGDSITEGHNASGMDTYKYLYEAGVAAKDSPYVHSMGWNTYFGLSARPDWANDSWAKQVSDALAAKYGDNIVMTNRGIGSTSAKWMNTLDNIAFLLGEGEGTSNLPTPDIAFIAYGMNEYNNPNETQINYTKNIVNFLRERNPDCSIVLVSAFVPYTTNAKMREGLAGHEQAYYEYAAEIGNATVVPVNAVFQSVLSAKQEMDYTGNMYNHPNDFGVNIYADTILAVLKGEEATLELNSNIEDVKPTYTGSTLIGGQVAITAPDVEGYTFSHFLINELVVPGDEINSTVVSMTGDTVVTAIYKDKTYTVTYYAFGEIIGEAQTVEHGANAVAPSAPVVEGYTFKGWDNAGTGIVADTEINAVYEINKYTVTYVADGVTVDTQTVEHGSDATAPEAPAKEGYTFVAWDNDGKAIKADTTITATYEIKTFTVTFKAGGEVLKTEKVNWNEAATAPTAPAKYGYTFKEWDNEFTNVVADIEVNAVYEFTGLIVKFESITGKLLGEVIVEEGDVPSNVPEVLAQIKAINKKVEAVYGYTVKCNEAGDVFWSNEVYYEAITTEVSVRPEYIADEKVKTNVYVEDVDRTVLIDRDARYDSAITLVSKQGATYWADKEDKVLLAAASGTLYACGGTMEIYAKTGEFEAADVAIVGKINDGNFLVFAHVNVENATEYGVIFASKTAYDDGNNADFDLEDAAADAEKVAAGEKTQPSYTVVKIDATNVSDFMAPLNNTGDKTRYARAYVKVNDKYIYTTAICNK